MKFINFKISRKYIFPLDNIARVLSCKIFTISKHTLEITHFVWIQSPGNPCLFSEPVRPLLHVHTVRKDFRFY